MMNCPSCGKENADGNWVCGHCGEALPAASQQPSQAYGGARPPAGAAPAAKSGSGIGTVTVILAAVLVVALGGMLGWFFFFRGPDTSTPGGTMEAYFKAVNDEDCEAIYAMTPGNELPQDRETAIDACSLLAGLFNINFADYQTLEETVDGDNATVTYQVTIEMAGMSVTGEHTSELVKEAGQWRVMADANVGGSSF